jgi:heat shock protein HtpX
MIPASGGVHRPHKRLSYRIEAVALLLAMAAIAALCAWILWGPDGIWLTLAAFAIGAVVVPRFAPRMTLQMFGAIPMAPEKWPDAFALSRHLAARAGLETTPALFRLPTDVGMAFSTGSSAEPVIALSNGLLQRLDSRELGGILAHEIAHLATGDIALRTLSELMARFTRLLSLFGLFAAIWLALSGAGRVPFATVLVLAVAPTAISLLQLALSRNREYEADIYAVELLGEAHGLVSALAKLEFEQMSLLRRLFWPYARSEMPSWLRTHPRTEDRIARLRALRPGEFHR